MSLPSRSLEESSSSLTFSGPISETPTPFSPLAQISLERLNNYTDLVDTDDSGSERSNTSDRHKIDGNDFVPCSFCQNIAAVFATSAEKQVDRMAGSISKHSIRHHSNFHDLVDSSDTCALCALVMSCFTESPVRGIIEDALIKAERFNDGGTVLCMIEEIYGSRKLISHLSLLVLYRAGSSSDGVCDEERLASEILRTYSEPNDPTSKNVIGRPVQPHADCPRILQLAKSWIEECRNNHTECQWSEDPSNDRDPVLPSRIIDIGESGSDLLRLMLSDGRCGKWVALSHRWPIAETNGFKTLKDNVLKMEEGFSQLSLPDTFQDAIKFTRALGIRFLWIDSLCIIQDSTEDWTLESARIAETYKNAYLTIAAAATTNSLGGMLVQREWVPWSQACKLSVPDTDIPGEIFIDFCIDGKHKKNANTDKDCINYLSSRAWCFQEAQLSRRLLTFDRLKMTYTCLRHGLQEDQEAVPAVAREYRNTFLSHFRGTFSGDDPHDFCDSFRVWYRVVEDYTARDLTLSSDKLIALSGIANVVGIYTGDDYLAGVWRKSLPQSLLWSPYDEENLPEPGYVASKSPQYRAPSWSWASLDSRISNFLCRDALLQQAVSTVLDVNTETAGTNKFGSVTNGLLVICGPFKKQVCGQFLSVWPQQPCLWRDIETDHDEDDISHCVFDRTVPDVGSTIWCLQITLRYGLILMPLLEGNDLYERVGVFHLRTSDVDNIRVPVRFSPDDIATVRIV